MAAKMVGELEVQRVNFSLNDLRTRLLQALREHRVWRCDVDDTDIGRCVVSYVIGKREEKAGGE